MRYTEIKNLENEEWRPVAGYEGRYYVSNYGRVKSHLRHGYNQTPCKGYEHLLKLVVLKIGYPSIMLWMHGKPSTKYVHRLVAAAFIGEIPQGMVVNHIDGDKTNNHVTNLEIITQSGNREHAARTGLLKGFLKERRPIAAMRDGQVLGEFPSIAEACRKLGLQKQKVNAVLHGVYNTHKGYTFKYL